MPLDDKELDERDQALMTEIETTFAEISLSPAQRARLHHRFRQTVTRQSGSGDSINWLGEESLDGPSKPSGPSPTAPRSDRRAGLTHGLGRAAVAAVLLLFLVGVLVARSLIPHGHSSRPGADGPAVSTVYAVQSETSSEQLLPLDPSTLKPQAGGPIQLSASDWAVSGDGSTVVTIDFEQGSTYIVVRSGFRGAERARFKSPVQGLLQPLQLNQDGSRLLVERQMDPSQWGVIDTSSGELLMSFQTGGISFGFSTPMLAEDVRLSPDGKHVYRFIFNNRVNATGSSALRIDVYDVATGQQTGTLSLPEVQVGTWAVSQAGAQEPLVYFLRPGIAISPDSKKIAIVDPGGNAVTMIDATKLTVERKVRISRSTGLLDRLLAGIGLSPRDAAAKTLDGVSRGAEFSADGKALYSDGFSYSKTSDNGPIGLGIDRIDLTNGKITSSSANSLPGFVVVHSTLSPDGKSLYVVGYSPSSNPGVNVQMTILRLDAQTLQEKASRPVDGVYSLELVTGDKPPATPTISTPTIPIGASDWPANSGDPGSMTLELSKTTVTPGEIITRTITNAGDYSGVITASAMLFEAQVNGTWPDIYYMGLGMNGEDPSDWVVGPGNAMNAAGYPPTALPARIPNVPPGTYRVRQDLSYDSAEGKPVQVTLSATITIVTP